MSTASLRRADEDTQPIPVVQAPAPGTPGRHAAPRATGRRAWIVVREVVIVAGVVIAIAVVARLLLGQVAYVADDAMEPTLAAGERVVVTTWGQAGAGDVVLVRSPRAWGSASGTAVARIIAVEGQRVACCDEAGRVTVDGQGLDEPYATGPTDQVDFDVTVPRGRVFVLVDRRDAARDSRASLEVEGGTLPVEDVLGRVALVVWPPRGPVV